MAKTHKFDFWQYYAGGLALVLPFGQLSPATEWGMLLACGGLALGAGGHAWRSRPIDLRLRSSLVLLAWWGLSSVMSLRPLTSIVTTLLWALPFFAFYLYLRAQPNPRKALRLLLALSGLSYMVLLAYHFGVSVFPGKAAIRPFFQDANYFAAALSLLLPGLLALVGERKQAPGWRLGAGAGAILVLLALIFLRSRGAWVGLGGASLLFAFALLRHWRQRLLLVAGTLALGLVVGGLLSPYLRDRKALPEDLRYVLSTTDVQTDFSNRERLMRWRCAWRMVQDDPFAGRGPGTFAPDFKHYLYNAGEVQQISYWFGWEGGGHSIWLTALAETGWIGLGLLLVWVGSLLGGLWQDLKLQEHRWQAALAVLAIGSWAIHGVFNDLLAVPALAGWLGLWWGAQEKKIAP